MMRDARDMADRGRSAAPAPRLTVRDAWSRPGNRRDPERRDQPPRPFQDRLDGTLVDVGVHRAVAYRDVVDAHFGGHPYTARRGVDKLKRAGLLEERKAKGPQGGTFTVLTATRGGAQLAQKLAVRRGYDARQQAWSGLGRAADLPHDIAIYRAVADARHRIEERKGSVSRIRLDAELRRTVAQRSERVRATHGPCRGRPRTPTRRPGAGPPRAGRWPRALSRCPTGVLERRRPRPRPCEHRDRHRALP